MGRFGFRCVWGAAVLCTGVGVGCADASEGSNPGKGVEAFVTPLTGIYDIASHTENLEGCDAEGDSVLGDASERFMVVRLKKSQLFGLPVTAASAISCGTVEVCRAIAMGDEDAEAQSMDFWFAFTQKVGDALQGEESSAGGAGFQETTCDAVRTIRQLRGTAAESVTIEVERQRAVVTRGTDEFCDFDSPKLTDAPCAEFEVVRGTFREAI